MTVTLAYDRTEGPVSDATTVVLIGSLGSNRSMWNPQIAALSAVAHVVALDLRGHGDSPVASGPCSVADLGADVVALMDSLDLDRAHVVGLSIGGAIAQWLAIHRPERIRTLTLMCTSAKFGESAQWRERAAAARRDGSASLADAVVERWFTPELAARDGDLIERCRAMISATKDEGYAGCCDALSQWDSRAELTGITAPTLVIAGAQDPSTTPDDLKLIADAISGATMLVLEPAAHLANIEQADRVNGAVAAHIRSESGTS